MLLLNSVAPCAGGDSDDAMGEQLRWFREQQRLARECKVLVAKELGFSHDPLEAAIAQAQCEHALPPISLGHSGDPASSITSNRSQASQIAVPLRLEGGIFVVPVQVNGTINLNFAVDSGAADVSVPLDVFSTLKRTGTIKESDILGTRTYILADGSKSESTGFRIRSLKVGDVTLTNVRGSVSPAEGMLLLGQSFLGRFKSWSIDNAKHELHLERR
jgi:clan AA aspartic protease (TIGR02281 family)